MSNFIRRDDKYFENSKLVNYSNIENGIGMSISANHDCLIITGDAIISDKKEFKTILIHIIKGWIQYESLLNDEEIVNESDSNILANNWLRQFFDER